MSRQYQGSRSAQALAILRESGQALSVVDLARWMRCGADTAEYPLRRLCAAGDVERAKVDGVYLYRVPGAHKGVDFWPAAAGIAAWFGGGTGAPASRLGFDLVATI